MRCQQKQKRYDKFYDINLLVFHTTKETPQIPTRKRMDENRIPIKPVEAIKGNNTKANNILNFISSRFVYKLTLRSILNTNITKAKMFNNEITLGGI